MRYFLLAGEASGDNLGALLLEELRRRDPNAAFAYWGGDAMGAAGGAPPRQHIRDLAFMGFAQVVRNLPTILRLLSAAKRDVAAFAPDVLVCVDYPGFNLRLARWAKARGMVVSFYVSPQIWAWRRSRVHRVIRDTSRVLCVLPFEEAFYAGYGYAVSYCGHPLPRRVDRYRPPARSELLASAGGAAEGPVVALLPGSRRQEIDYLLPVYVAAVAEYRRRHPGTPVRFVIAAAPPLDDARLAVLRDRHAISAVRETYALLSHADAAWTASGTATLETALFGVPQVVCYRAGAVSVWLARRLIEIDYIALVNVILDRPAVPELIQDDLHAAALASWTGTVLLGGGEAERQARAYALLRERLLPYEATAAAAALIVADARAAAGEQGPPDGLSLSRTP